MWAMFGCRGSGSPSEGFEQLLVARERLLGPSGEVLVAVSNAVEAARRVLADRDRFELDADALARWEAVNARRARVLPGLGKLVQRPSPFAW